MQSIDKGLATIRSIVSSVQNILVALLFLIGVFMTAAAAVFGGGSPALDQALAAERKAQEDVRSARDASVPDIREVICTAASDVCDSPFKQNLTEDAILSAFDVGTRMTIEGKTSEVAGPADVPEISPPSLENDLVLAIGADIRDTLRVDSAIVQSAIYTSHEYFGDKHEYARRVRDLLNAEVTRKALEASPDLVEKPAWWRDLLLGGGTTLAGAMVGAILGAWAWRRIERRRQRLPDMKPTEPAGPEPGTR